MKPLKLDDPNLVIENKQTSPKKLTYQLASLTKITFARIFDLLIVAIPQFLLNFFWPISLGNWTSLFLVLFISFLVLVSYFIVLPLFIKGNTIGKLIFNLRLKTGNDSGTIKWYALIIRELYFWFIPWIVGVITTTIAIELMQLHANENKFWLDAHLLYNLGYFFFLIWFAGLAISIKVQKEHQSGIDIKLNLYVVEKNPLDKLETKKAIKLTTYDHVSLSSMPGNFDEDKLHEIAVDEEKVFQQSINLTDLDQLPKREKIDHQQNLISKKEEEEKKK